jgi:hypothetical protein
MSDDTRGNWNETGRDTREGVPALVLWVLVQGVVLLAAWKGMQFTAKPTYLASAAASKLMLIAQFVMAVAIFPSLVVTWRVGLLAAAIAFPFGQLAGRIAGDPLPGALLHYLDLLLFLGALACWRKALPRRRWAHLSMACALTLWVLGLPLLWYLLGEHHPDQPLQNAICAVSPLLLTATGAHRDLVVVLLVHGAAAATAVALKALSRRPHGHLGAA